MKFPCSRAALFIALWLPLNAQAYRGGRYRGKPVIVTVYEEAPPVVVTATAASAVITSAPDVPIRNTQDGVSFPSLRSSPMESIAPSETSSPIQDQQPAKTETPTQPTPGSTEKVTVFKTPASTPEPSPTVQKPKDVSSGASLTISITNLYGTPLSIGLGSNYGGPTPDGNPEPTTIASALSYTFPVGWAGRISVGKSLSGCNSLIEASYDPTWPRAIDVSYVDGYSVPITCSVNDKAVTGCNIELFDQGIECDTPLDNGACPNSARNHDNGPPAAFFSACQGSAYTFPKDDTATNGGITGLEISCCIGTSCPKPSLQKSEKRGLPSAKNGVAEPISKRESTLDRAQHVHQHQERHRWISPRSHVHQLVQDAKMRR
jgi:hypothetical protein